MIEEIPIIETKETLGQQIINNHDKYAGQKTQTVRETTDEMGKEYMKSLWKIVEQHAHVQEDYYITEIMKADSILPNTVHCKHIARKSMPLPEWGIACYRVSNKLGECFYEFGLPSEGEGELIRANPLGWDKKTVEDVLRFFKYLEFFNLHKPKAYGNYHSLPMAVKFEIIKTMPSDIRKEFDEKCAAYWEELLKQDFVGT